MTEPTRKLARPPIIEAVLDIDCDLPPNRGIESLLEPARNCFNQEYPDVQTRYMFEHQIKTQGDATPETVTRRGLQGYLFRTEDRKQLVQVRSEGFSFNRLAPYSSLDDYLPEIERTWELFQEIAQPIRIGMVRLRYINKLALPMEKNSVNLETYLKVGPRLPDEEKLVFQGFLNQHLALEAETRNEVKIILTSQKPENDRLPVIFDITAANGELVEPIDWSQVLTKLQSLRRLKNRVFYNTLTPECLLLFQ